MRFRIFSFETEIIFSDEYVNLIQIENHKLFGRLVSSIYKMSNGIREGIDEKVILEDNEKILDFSKETMFIMDFMNFDFNQRKVQNGIYHYVEQSYNFECGRLDEFQTTFHNLYLDVFDILVELPFEFAHKENIEVSDYLKMLGLKINPNNCKSILEQLLLIIDVVQTFHLAKVLFLVNVKSFLEEEEVLELYKYSKYKKLELLLLEGGKEEKNLNYEKVLLIDSDYDEIILYNNKRI